MKKSKIIWILNHYAITPEYPGGTRHYELALRLSNLGHKVVIFASSVLHQNPETNILENELPYKIVDINHNFKFIWVKTVTYKKNNFRRIINMLSFIWQVNFYGKAFIMKKMLQKPDIIVGSTVHPLTPLIAKHLANKFNSDYVFEIRDLWPKSFIDMGLWKEKSINSLFFYYIEKASIKKAKSIICLSPLTESYLMQRYNILGTTISYIPNGTNILSENTQKAVLNVDGKFDTSQFNVVFTGAIISSNRVNVICEAAVRLSGNSNIQLNIIGDGNEKNEFIKRYNQLNNIKWFDPIPKKDIPLVLKSADVLLLIQGKVAWGSSNKLYDYLAAGKPIISSVWVSHNDFVDNINAGISVPAEDSEKLAQAIMKMYGLSNEERRLMGNNAIEFVKKYHNWDDLVQKFMHAIFEAN